MLGAFSTASLARGEEKPRIGDIASFLAASETDEKIRNEAVAAVVELGLDATGPLRDLVARDANNAVHFMALEAWARIEAKSIISTDELNYLHTSAPSGTDRLVAECALNYRKGGGVDLPLVFNLAKSLDKGTPEEKLAALKRASWPGWESPALAPVYRSFLDSPDADVRDAAAGALTALGADAMNQWLDAAESKVPEIRRLAMKGLARVAGENHSPKAQTALMLGFFDRDKLVRRYATQGLVHFPIESCTFLISGLQRGDETVRKAVLDDLLSEKGELIQIFSSSTVSQEHAIEFAKGVAPPLLDKLRSGDRREQAIAVIKHLPLDDAGPKAVEILGKALANTETIDRISVTKSLTLLWPASLAALADAARDGDSDVRLISLDFLQSHSTPRHPLIDAAMVAALSDTSQSIRCMALAWIDSRPNVPQGVAPGLANMLTASSPSFEKDPQKRASVVAMLGRFGADPRVSVPVLCSALDDKDVVRRTAVISLRAFGAEASPAIPKLMQMFEQDSLRTEVAATLLATGAMPQKKLVAYCVERMSQPLSKDPLIQNLRMLSMIGPGAADAVPRIEPLLRSADNELRIEAAQTLGAIGPAAASSIPLLTRMADNRNADVRQASTEALIRVARGGKGLGPALLAAIYNGDVPCTARLAAGLRAAGVDPSLMRRLDALAVDDPDPAVRAGARRAVEFLSPPPGATTRPGSS